MLLVDVQGTLIDDENRKPIDGAIEFVRQLKNSNTPFALITNNTKQSSSQFRTYLRSLGFEFTDNQYLDPFGALDRVIGDGKIFAIGNDGFIGALRQIGYDTACANPNFVVLSLKEDLSYDDMATAVELVLNGAKLVGMHETAIYAKNGRKYPGLGAILRCIEYATNTKASIVGKPSDDFYDMARMMVGAAEFSQLTIVSDDAIGDLVGAKRLGMKTILALSGKYRKKEEILPFLAKDEQPDSVVASVADIRWAS